jgi:hypothetical protein
MPFKCKQAFPREEKCLLDHLSPFWDLLQSVLQSFIPPLSMVALTAVRDRDDEVCSVTASCSVRADHERGCRFHLHQRHL